MFFEVENKIELFLGIMISVGLFLLYFALEQPFLLWCSFMILFGCVGFVWKQKRIDKKKQGSKR